MRIDYISSATAQRHSLDWWAANGQDPDTALHLVRTWAHSPHLQECQQRLGHALHQQTSVPHRVKELVIVRVCAINFSGYELYHHLPAARGAGLLDDELDALLACGAAVDSRLSEQDRTCVRFVDAFDAGWGIPAELFDELRSHFGPDQIIAMAMQAGYWGCNARLTRALESEEEPWMDQSRHPASIDSGAPIPPAAPVDTEPGGRLGVPAPAALSERSQRWLDRWPGGLAGAPMLVRAWAWSEHAQVASQRLWAALAGDDVELAMRQRCMVIGRICWRRHAPYLVGLAGSRSMFEPLEPELAMAVASGNDASGVLSSSDKALLTFVDEWEAGWGLSRATFDAAASHFTPRQLVEAQLVAGFFGTQARIANALELPVESG